MSQSQYLSTWHEIFLCDTGQRPLLLLFCCCEKIDSNNSRVDHTPNWRINAKLNVKEAIMNKDDALAVAVLLSMKQTVVESSVIGEVRANAAKIQENWLFTAPYPNRATNRIKHSHVKRTRADYFSECPQSGLSQKSASKLKPSETTKKPKMISPVSTMDTITSPPHQSSDEKSNMASASLLPLLSETFKSSDLPLMNTLSPKMTSHAVQLGTAQSVATFHQEVPGGVVKEPVQPFNIPFVPYQIQDHQSSQLSTQDVLSALLTAEIQKMRCLVNVQQEELHSVNHVSNYIADVLSHQVPSRLGQLPSLSPHSFPFSYQRQELTTGEHLDPTSSVHHDPVSASVAERDSYSQTNNVDGNADALFLNLLQQAILSGLLA